MPYDDTTPDTEAETSNTAEVFAETAIDRRTFVSLAAATGVSLSLPGSASGEVDIDVLTPEAQFVVNHTPDAYRAPLVVEFESVADAEAFDEAFEFDTRRGPETDLDGNELVRPPKTTIRTEPTPAGHGLLETDEVESLVEMDGVVEVDFAPGANPFWTLDEDPYGQHGVFPDPEDARDYLDYEEVRTGLTQLEADNPDRMNLIELESSPGWMNLFVDERERYPLQVVEVTNDINDETAFEQKEKVVFELGIHGDEPQGREAGSRIIEDIMTGEAPAFEETLDDIVIIFFYINPDGWISRRPTTELAYDDLEFDDTSFLRGHGSYVNIDGEFEFTPGNQLDTNRQFPTIGWTNPGFYPAEPTDAPDFFDDVVPDSLATVEHFRGYENVEFLCDYHGMGIPSHMVYNLETNAPFDHVKTHNLDEVSIRIGDGMVADLGGETGDVTAIEDDIAAAIAEHYNLELEEAYDFIPPGQEKGGFLDWGTIYDTLNYQVTGAFLGWAGVPEEQGGLGAITVAPEMMHSNPDGNTYLNWKPYWSRHQIASYRISMREYAQLAAADTNATLETGDTATAFLETEQLTRSSEDLPHTGADAATATETAASGATVRHEKQELSADSPGMQVASAEETTSLYVNFHSHTDLQGELVIRGPDNSVKRRIDLDDGVTAASNCFLNGAYVHRPDTGEWAVEASTDADVGVEMIMVDSPFDFPDPRNAWYDPAEGQAGEPQGFEQQSYEVNPMQFFHDLAPFIEDEGTLEGVDRAAVKAGALTEYDQLVISHDGGTDDDVYLAAVESFVENGGDLVLTDRGVHLLGVLDVGSLTSILPENVRNVRVNFVNLDDRNFNHPLLDGIRERQQELWKGPQVGYTTGVDQPATVIDPDAFDSAGGLFGGTIRGDPDDFAVEPGEEIVGEPGVGVGTFVVGESTINVIGSLLPPAQQDVLHPFGIADYSLSFMGHTVLCNALGYVQRRLAEGTERTYGGAELPQAELLPYTNTEGVVDSSGLQDAFGDWQAGEISADNLNEVFAAWQSGEPI